MTQLKTKTKTSDGNINPPTQPPVAVATPDRAGTRIKTEVQQQIDDAKQEAKLKVERKIAYKMKMMNALKADFPKLYPKINKLKDKELNQCLNAYKKFKKMTSIMTIKPGQKGYVVEQQAKQRLEQKLLVKFNNVINHPQPKPVLPKKGRGIVNKYNLKGPRP